MMPSPQKRFAPLSMSTPASPLTHFDAQGQAHMVDVGAKAATHRVAVATGRIEMQPETLALIESGTAKKGDVLGVARIVGIFCSATVETVGQTGVEMEALTAVQVALLTIYDMCKAVDKRMVMTEVRVIEKIGGKSGNFLAATNI